MLRQPLFRFSSNPWKNGLRLALLNVTLAAVCMVTFVGTLLAIGLLNRLILTGGGSPSSEVPFPYPLLLLSYLIMFLVVWVSIGRRLPDTGRARLLTALVGAAPLFCLSLLGYLSTVGVLIVNEYNPGWMPVASFFVFGGLSTLVLFAGFACVGLIVLGGVNGLRKSTNRA